MKYKTFAMNYEHLKFNVEESISVEEHTNYIDIKKNYKYGYIGGFHSLDMTNATAIKLRDLLNKIFPVEGGK